MTNFTKNGYMVTAHTNSHDRILSACQIRLNLTLDKVFTLRLCQATYMNLTNYWEIDES